jgi:hypothetical protein
MKKIIHDLKVELGIRRRRRREEHAEDTHVWPLVATTTRRRWEPPPRFLVAGHPYGAATTLCSNATPLGASATHHH